MSLVTSFLSSPAGRPVGRLVHAVVLRRQARSQSLATSFFRNLRQLGVLEGPLSDVLRGRSPRILVAGCSLGCEAWTLAGYLKHRIGLTDFSILAVDIEADAVAFGQAGLYGEEHLPAGPGRDRSADLIAAMFAGEAGGWRIKDDLRRHVTFRRADVLAPGFADLGVFDLVLGQNFLIHMDDAAARRAMAALAARPGPGGGLFLAGVELGLRAGEARRLGLAPVDWRLEALHEEDHVRRGGWPWSYWGLEPYDRTTKAPAARYATVYRVRG
jgi:SAM-dependent methyltransferase